MKRSEINGIIKKFEGMLAEYRFALPDFLSFTPEDWKTKGHDYDEIRDNALGWDITDFGLGDFYKEGLALITIRNGNVHMDKYTKVYAEKICYCPDGGSCPSHYHWSKMEDIINRGGGELVFKFYNANEDGSYADTDILINQDGHEYYVKPGEEVILNPGQSITLYPGYYHEYFVRGDVLVGEVSMCNDDANDNCFYKPVGRFPEIEEDEPPYRLLCNEYPAAE